MVKFPPAREPKNLINEVIGAGLCGALGLPSPAAALVEVPVALTTSGELAKRGVSAGQYFGSEVVLNAVTFTSPTGSPITPHQIVNRADMAQVLAFDTWTVNTDRNGGNILAELDSSQTPARFRIHMIDHGRILSGPSWTAPALAAYDHAALPPLRVPRIMQDAILALGEFTPFQTALRGLTDVQIDAACAAVPAEWGTSPQDVQAAKAFLETRKTHMNNVFSRAFLQRFLPHLVPAGGP